MKTILKLDEPYQTISTDYNEAIHSLTVQREQIECYYANKHLAYFRSLFKDIDTTDLVITILSGWCDYSIAVTKNGRVHKMNKQFRDISADIKEILDIMEYELEQKLIGCIITSDEVIK